MKAKALKKEVIHTLQTVAKWIGDKNTPDYDLKDLKSLLDRALEHYAIYLDKEDQYNGGNILTQDNSIYADGVRVKIREYLDEL